MGIETIGQEVPLGRLWVGANHLADMVGVINFGPSGPNVGCHHFPRDDIQTGNQTLGAMADIFKLLALDFARSHRQVKSLAFQGLNPRHFIGGNRAFALLGSADGRQVQISDLPDLLVKVFVFFGGFSQYWL